MNTTQQKTVIRGQSIGADIEWFLRDKSTGKIITAEGKIQGTKKNPYKFDKDNSFYATSLDCVLSEGNIPPCKTEGEFYLAVQHLLRYISNAIPQNLEPIAIPAARLEEDQLISDIANEFGCEKSLNCWTHEDIQPQPTGDTLRSAGFHLHCSYEDATEEISLSLGKAMDLFLGVPSILIEPENERRVVGYGCAGNVRLKQYGDIAGIEYRTLSSHFASSKNLTEWAFRNTEKAIEFINQNRLIEIVNFGDEIQHIINNTDKEMAKEFVHRFNLEIV